MKLKINSITFINLIGIILGILITCNNVYAQGIEIPDKNYLKKFPIETAFTAIIEYVNPEYTQVVAQRLFKSSKPFKAGEKTTIKLTGLSVNLYGLSPCPSEEIVELFTYKGACNKSLAAFIDTELQLSPILICRSFMKFSDKPIQDATCWTLYVIGEEAIVHNVEDALLRVGAAFLTRDKDQQALRPDLLDAEIYARKKETGIWNENAKKAMGFK